MSDSSIELLQPLGRVLERLAGQGSLDARLVSVLARPTLRSSSGWPFLERRAWLALRDRVPLLFHQGNLLLEACGRLESALAEESLPDEQRASFDDALKVVRQVVMTAAITAPTDLWLLRQVLGFFAELNLPQRLLDGEALYPEDCWVETDSGSIRLNPGELDKDLRFLLSRGVVEQYDDSYRIAGHPRARRLLEGAGPVPSCFHDDPTRLWHRVFSSVTLENHEIERLLDGCHAVQPRLDDSQHHWMPTLEEVEAGFRLVPIVLGLKSAGRNVGVDEGDQLSPSGIAECHPSCGRAALDVLKACGWVSRYGERYTVTALGARGLKRAHGPFGIIQAYHPYMSAGRQILLSGRGQVWVERGENVAASQAANARSFTAANDSIDRFCADSGFSYRVFIEHAVGRGEATRQRWRRSGDDLVYVGADLEQAALDAAAGERDAGRLPPDMHFIQADIGRPDLLVANLEELGLEPKDAVMIVGNGFHEVREQTDERMIDVFRGYHDAGFLIVFTEENALSIDDLRATAWNTYHAGFKYLHEKSGQGLRPADERPPSRLGLPLRAAWSECASAAGYVALSRYDRRARTIYPSTPPHGHNPAISVNHFMIPKELAERLELE